LLQKTYFGGGTVEASLSAERYRLPSEKKVGTMGSLFFRHLRYHILRKLPSERFEDGTIPFTSIVALKFGFDTLQQDPAPGGTVSGLVACTSRVEMDHDHHKPSRNGQYSAACALPHAIPLPRISKAPPLRREPCCSHLWASSTFRSISSSMNLPFYCVAGPAL